MNIYEAIEEELKFARKHFPTNKHMLAALGEEVGELNKALMEHDRDPTILAQHVFLEGIQVAAMAIRVIQDGDPQFKYKYHERFPDLLKGRGDQ